MSEETARRQFRSKAVLIVHFVVWLALAVYVVHMIMPMITSSSFGIQFRSSKNGDFLKIKDFPFHFNFVQKAWQRKTTIAEGSSIYSVANHLKVTSEWAGRPIPYSLQFGYSPTMLLILAPLVPLSPAAAFLLFDLAGLFAVFWMTRPGRCRLGVCLLLFFSPLARGCFYVGQTAIVTGAGLLFLAENTRDGRRENWRNAGVAGIVLWAMTTKPPIALAAAAVLLGLRRWRTLGAACVFTVISTLLVLPLLGPHWVTDYLHLIRSYNKIDAGPTFSFSIVPEIMGNLRAILSVDIGLRDDVASLASAAVWLVSLVAVTVAGLRSRVPAAALWAMGILSYLLFCPHVSPPEEIQVVVILALCLSLGERLSSHEMVLLIALPLLVFLSPIPGFFYGMRLPLFLSQLALLFFFAFTGDRFAATA